MNVYQRFMEMKRQENEREVVECHDATHGNVYKNLEDLPISLAEQPAQYAYFRFMPRVAK